jgi:hypothetical protein
MRIVRTGVTLALLGALGLTACSAGAPGAGPSGTPAVPVVDPAAAPAVDPTLAPVAEAPEEWRTLPLGPVVLDVPGGFEMVQEPDDDDARTASWVARRGDQDGARAAISVARDTDPTRTPAQSAEAALRSEESQRGAHDGERTALTWPGVQDAAHLSYLQDVLVGSRTVEHRAEWVYADLPDGSQVAVGVVAPVEMFDELGLHEVLETWRPA